MPSRPNYIVQAVIENILEIKNLTKFYGDLEAVRGISFGVESGEIVGLLGPNGAGKTTTINMVLGILAPTSGSIQVFGKNFSDNREEILGKTNFAAVYAQLPGNLSVRHNLFVFAVLYGVPRPKERVKELLREYDLEKYSESRTGLLSSGEQSRVNLAKSQINKPRLLLLDEPTASIDPSSAQIVREQIRNYAKTQRAAVLWTSHNMHEIEEVCDRVLFISHGKILLAGKPKELPGRYGKKNLEELFIAVAREPLSLQ